MSEQSDFLTSAARFFVKRKLHKKCGVFSARKKGADFFDTLKKTAADAAVFCVGIDLSSRSVSRQVFSAPVSLTSVFGMGTGGPSPLKTPTMVNDLRQILL